MNFAFHPSFVLQSNGNDTAAQLPITSESQAAEAVNEATTDKAVPEGMQGAV